MRGLLAAVSGLAFCLSSYAGAQDSPPAADCSAATARLQAELKEARDEAARSRRDLAAARAELEELSGKGISILDIGSTYFGIAGDAVQQALDQTSLDEQAATHAAATKAMLTDALDYVRSLDVAGVRDQALKHELYVTKVAPLIASVSTQAQPYIDQYVSPALASAAPHIEAAKTAAAPAHAAALDAYASVTEKHLPALQEACGKAWGSLPGSEALSTLEAKVSSFLHPAFAFIAKISPKQARILPKNTIDRVLLIIISMVVMSYFYYVLKFSLKITLKVTWKTCLWAFWAVVALPFRLLRKVIGICLCLSTCGCCCGICRRKQAKSDEKGKSKENGKAAAKKAGKATAEEVAALLTESKKKNKLETAAKLLSTVALKGQVMDGAKFPAEHHGKTIDKETFKKAAKQFKELDLKKLGL